MPSVRWFQRHSLLRLEVNISFSFSFHFIFISFKSLFDFLYTNINKGIFLLFVMVFSYYFQSVLHAIAKLVQIDPHKYK
jgi:hypothetical protein